MSLVNQMLQDLQNRKAADSKPLNGLHAVPAGVHQPQAAPVRRWFAIAAAVTCMAAVLTLGLQIDVGDRPDQAGQVAAGVSPQVADPLTTDKGTTAPPLKTVDYPMLTSLATNRLDYRLRSPPRSRLRRSSTAKQPAVIEVPKKIRVTKVAAPIVGESVEPAFRKTIDPAKRLRRNGLDALQEGQAVAAEQHFSQLIQIDPADPEPYLYLHAALQTQSRNTDARTALMQGLKKTSAPSRLAKVLAHDLLAAGLADDALAVLMRHRPTGVVDPDYDASLAAIHQRAGNHATATDLYAQLVNSQPGNGDWWVGLAISQEAQGLLPEATESFATAAAAGSLDLRLARYAAQRLEELEKGS